MAASLPKSDKLALIDDLLAQVDAPDPAIEKAWAEEVDRRIDADAHDTLQSLPFDQAMARYQKS